METSGQLIHSVNALIYTSVRVVFKLVGKVSVTPLYMGWLVCMFVWSKHSASKAVAV